MVAVERTEPGGGLVAEVAALVAVEDVLAAGRIVEEAVRTPVVARTFMSRKSLSIVAPQLQRRTYGERLIVSKDAATAAGQGNGRPSGTLFAKTRKAERPHGSVTR
jgi:hypothetical protein